MKVIKNSVRKRRFSRAFSTLGCPEKNIEDVLALARAQEIEGVEIRVLDGSLNLPEYFSRRAKSGPSLESLIATAGVQITSLSTSLRLIDGTEADRADFLSFVPWAEMLGVPRLRVFDGGCTAQGAELERAVETIHWWTTLRATRGWKTDIMIETHDALTTAASITRFVHTVPNIAILWDTHHTWRKGGEAPLETWRAIRNHVVHVHVKDSVSAGVSSDSFRYVLPGMGEFPMRDLQLALESEFSGTVSLEWEKQWHPELPSLETALQWAATNSWW